jgi:hypothetical protein
MITMKKIEPVICDGNAASVLTDDLVAAAKYFSEKNVVVKVSETEYLDARFICEAAIHEINRLRAFIWGKDDPRVLKAMAKEAGLSISK